jgi:short-subunit dehydrogenase
MKYSVTGKVVLITGPARGIGEEAARQLAARGARLSLVGREPERLADLAAELGAEHLWFECDVTDQATLESAAAETGRRLGGIDVVIANAGIASHGTVAVTPVEAQARTIEVNLLGVLRTVHATLPYVTRSRGQYQLVSSAAAFAAMPGMAAYAASKAGVEQFGNALRLELAHQGVSVGVVHPAWIDTDLVRDAQAELASFRETLRTLPRPFGAVTSVRDCAAAMVRGIEGRRRRVFVPGALAVFAALRQVMASRAAEWMLEGQLRRRVPQMEAEAQRLERPFGRTSMD